MKKLLLLAVILMAGNICLAQNAKNIIGKWAYVDLHDKSENDDTTNEMAAMLFAELKVNFRTDNTMSLVMRNTPDNGTYAFDNDNENIIHAQSQTGKTMPITIIKLTESELVLKLGQLAAMVLHKVSPTPDPLQ